MFRFRYTILFFFIFFGWLSVEKCLGQNKTIDSLKLALKNAKNDTTRCNLLSAIIEFEVDDNISSLYNEELIDLAKTNLESKTKYQKFYKKQLSSGYNNSGFFLKHKGNVSAAIDYYAKSLKIMEEIGDKHGIAYLMGNLGSIYGEQGDLPEAIGCWNKSLNIMVFLEDKIGQGIMLNNLGGIYYYMGDTAKALKYSMDGLKIMEEINNKRGIASSLISIGSIFYSKKDYMNSMKYYKKSLKIQYGLGDKLGITYSLYNIGNCYLKIGDIKNAEEFSLKSLALSKEIGFPQNIRNAAKSLYIINKSNGNYKSALEYYVLNIQMSDSINNETTRKASIKSQLKYEYEKQAAADSVAHAKESEIKNAEIAKQTAEIKAKKNQQYALFGGLGLVMIFAGFMYNRFKVTQKQKLVIESQKEIVEEQKHLVEEKQKEILDSIHYAQRIQKAHLPGEKHVAKNMERLRRRL